MKGKSMLVAVLLSVTPVHAEDDQRLTESRHISKLLQEQLGSRLKSAMSDSGPVGAISACHLDAPIIASQLSAQFGVQVGRTALKFRNPSNMPDADQRAVMLEFQLSLEEGKVPVEHYATAPDGSARYMKAIVVQSRCLACHGRDLAPEIKTAITALYPGDRATGFAVGDLRGAFVIQWPPPKER
jgi:hypothetical protein